MTSEEIQVLMDRYDDRMQILASTKGNLAHGVRGKIDPEKLELYRSKLRTILEDEDLMRVSRMLWTQA